MNRINQELIEASGENNLPEVRRLLSVGADVNATFYGRTHLNWACSRGHLQVVKVLREHGADIGAKDSDGWTPLHCACAHGHVAVVIELLSRGANTEAKTYQGDTPLHLASDGGGLPVVKALLSGGADILAANKQGELPVHEAVRFRRPAVAKYLLQELYATPRRLPLHELVEDLTWIGDPDSSDVLTWIGNPLRASLDENVLGTDDVVEILECLVSRNPELLSARDQDGSLPLHVACRRVASFPVVQFLVNRYKASVKSGTSHGDLPLFLACEMSETSLDTIFLLVKLYPDLVYR
jgi:ankyrin repeat protein